MGKVWGCDILKVCVCLCSLQVLFSCDKQDNGTEIKETPYFTSFVLSPEDNPELKKEWVAEIKDSVIFLHCPELKSSESLRPRFDGHFKEVIVDDEHQETGLSTHNFNNPITYHLIGENNIKKSYKVIIKVANNIPTLYIDTENEAPIDSKERYVRATARLLNTPDWGVAITADCKIRGRGNATWDTPKKPYKLKFDEKQTPCKLPSNRDWVLLAEYKDATLMRTAIMCEVSEIIGMEYTVSCQYIDLYLNNSYEGTYVLTDLVEKGKHRVNISDDGFLIERDNWYKNEPLWFTTGFDMHYTFKYPDADDGDIVENSSEYNYIKDFMCNLEQAVKKLDDDPTNTDYLNYIDLQSFAKWALLAQVLCVFDPNAYYYLPTKGDKLRMGPMWDMEYSLGFWTLAWGPKPDPIEETNVLMETSKYYFYYLLKSPKFRDELKNEYLNCREKLMKVDVYIDSLQHQIQYTQEDNFNRWFIYNEKNNWGEELLSVKSFFQKRINWLDNNL